MFLKRPFPCKLACKLIGGEYRNELIAEGGEPELYKPYDNGTSGAYVTYSAAFATS